jgi:hypothetical protein
MTGIRVPLPRAKDVTNSDWVRQERALVLIAPRAQGIAIAAWPLPKID